MAASKLTGGDRNIKGTIIGREVASLSIGAAAETLATAGATIVAKTTKVLLIPEHAIHWHPTSTPTSSFGHAVAAGEPVQIEHRDIARAKFIRNAGGDTTAVILYLR